MPNGSGDRDRSGSGLDSDSVGMERHGMVWNGRGGAIRGAARIPPDRLT